MRGYKITLICFFCAGIFDLSGQSPLLEEIQFEYDLLDRWHNTGLIHIPHRSVNTINIHQLASLEFDTSRATLVDLALWEKLNYNSPELNHFYPQEIDLPPKKKGWLKTFYKDDYNFYKLDTDDFFLKIDPVVQFAFGDDARDDNLIFQNTRGLKIRGVIDKKVYFATNIYENQQRFLNYVEDEIDRISSIPGQGFFKPYQSGIIDNLNGWDFLNANSYVGLNISKSINMQLGHGKNFIGNGIRSLLLSDYAHNYFYFQFNTRVWKLHYQNTFAELSTYSTRANIGDELVPKKYMATHYLSFQASKKLSLGLFESVIFSRENNFEFQYLNPVILYRSVEQFLDSPDNVLLGINLNYNPSRHFFIYGQLMLDELKTSEAFAGRGWWGNKVAYQIGIKSYDLFNMNNLDVQVEHNTARPFTYAHRSDEVENIPVTSYSHANQPLAHPYGANFRETLFRAQFRPHRQWYISGNTVFSNYGEDTPDNAGRNILTSYEIRNSDYNHFTGQGISNSIFAQELNVSYEFFPNYFVELNWLYRNQNVENSESVKTNYIGIGFRANMSRRSFLF